MQTRVLYARPNRREDFQKLEVDDGVFQMLWDVLKQKGFEVIVEDVIEIAPELVS